MNIFIFAMSSSEYHSNKQIPKPSLSRTTRSSLKKTNVCKSQALASKSCYYCNGCKKTFSNVFKSPSQFLRDHMSVTNQCSKAIIHCDSCNKSFINEKCFMSHLSRSNIQCRQYHNKKASSKKKARSYNTSEVTIPEQLTFSLDKMMNQSSQSTLSPQSLKKLKMADVNHNTLIHNVFKTTSCIECIDTSKVKTLNVKNQILDTKDEVINSQRLLLEKASFNKMPFDSHQIDSILESSNEKVTTTDKSIVDNSRFFLNDEDNEDIAHHDDLVNVDESNEDESHLTQSMDDVILHHHHQLYQTHFHIGNENHLINLLMIHRKEVSNYIIDHKYLDGLKLIQLMMKKNMSISSSSVKEFMDWKYDFKPHTHYTLDQIKRQAEKSVYGSTLGHKMQPNNNLITCPSGRKTNVTTFDIDAAILDLLIDPNITNPDSMIFEDGTQENPFIIKNKDYYDDLDQSGIYQETYKKLITNPDQQILCPIIIYLDETNLDSFSKLVLHPVVITLAIYKRETRNLAMAWRPIGYLPNFQEQFGQKCYTAKEKANDFHYCLRYILDGIEKIQKLNGLYWEFQFSKYPGQKYKRLLKFTLSHVVSDAKENDLICGRMSNRTNTLCLARDCDISIENSDNPDIKCNFHAMKDLEQLTHEELHSFSFKKIMPYNAFSQIDFGYNPYGINGCTPCEPLHQINGGVVERLPVTFMNRLSCSQVKLLDTHVAFLCTHFSRHSDKSILNLKPFRNGVSSVSKLTGKEKVSRLLAIFLTLLTSDFEQEIIDKKGRRDNDSNQSSIISKIEYNSWIKVFEDTLILTSWVNFKRHPKVVFNGGRNSLAATQLRRYMINYNNIAKRKEGMGNKYLKFHQISHLWWVIRLFSSLPNIDSGRNESHHKKKKQIGSHTQKRLELFDIQTAEKEYVHDLFIKAMKKASLPIPTIFETKINATRSETHYENIIHSSSGGSKYLLTFDYENECINSKWLSKSLRSKDCNFPSPILEALYLKLKWYNKGQLGHRIKSIIGFTEFKTKSSDNEDLLFRSCPNYRSERHWFDWVVVDWDEPENELEAQVLLFLNLETIELETFDQNDTDNSEMEVEHEIVPHKYIAMVHSCQFDHSIKHSRRFVTQVNGYLKNKLCYFRTMENKYQIISTEAIVGTCAVVVDTSKPNVPTHVPGSALSVIVVGKSNNWHLHFIDYNNDRLMKDASENVDNDYPIGSERYPFEG